MRHIFAGRLGDPVADTIYAALRAAPDGLSRTEISHVLGRHKSAGAIDTALEALVRAGQVTTHGEDTAGRSRQVWVAASA